MTKVWNPVKRAKRLVGVYLRDRELERTFRSATSPAPWQFVLFAGIGDQLLWLSLLPEFRRRADREVVVYCEDRSSPLAAMYTGRAFDRLIKIPPLSDRAMKVLKSRTELLPGRGQLAWHDCYVEHDLKYLFGKDLSNGDLVRELLMLPSDAPMHAPECTEEMRLAATEHMHRWRLPIGNTVLIAPWVKSWPNLPKPWWGSCARSAGMASRWRQISAIVADRSIRLAKATRSLHCLARCLLIYRLPTLSHLSSCADTSSAIDQGCAIYWRSPRSDRW